MGAIVALVGLIGFAACIIWLIINAIRWDSKAPPIVGIMVCFVLVFVGTAMYSHSGKGFDSFKDNKPISQKNGDDAEDLEGPAENETQEPEEPQQYTSVPASSGDLGAYHVEIKDAVLAKDYEDHPAIVITYAWTNNSDDTTSAMVAAAEKAFQDGIQLDSAVIVNSDVYDSGANSKNVRPGATIDVQCAYLLTSETSMVEFEIQEFFSFSGEKVTKNFDLSSL